MEFSSPGSPKEDSPYLPFSLDDSNGANYLDSTPFLEYLGQEPLILEKTWEPQMHIYPGNTYTFGLENCDCNIPDPERRVSKRHFRIYTIVYEKGDPNVPALVYCEDFQSRNGTYVNGILIGKMYRDRIAYLLTDGDIIEIKPSWKFRFHQQNSGLVAVNSGSGEDKKAWVSKKDYKHFRNVFAISNRMLGQGNFGTVYLAKEVEYSEQVACKIIDLEKVAESAAKDRTGEDDSSSPGDSDDQSRKRKKRALMSTIKKELRKEIRILAKLSHPNIINLRKAYYSDTFIYIFTDLAPGGDLFSYIDAHGGHLEDLQCRMIAWQLMQAVDYMHSQGIVHRDIKTENVLIAQTDLGGRVILTDFGHATYEDQTTGRLRSIVGTTGYLAPELESSRGYTKAVDLWASGTMVALMLTGDKPDINLRSPTSDLQEQVDLYCEQLMMHTHVKANSVDFVRKLLDPSEVSRLSAPSALQHKWFTESKREDAAQREVYRRITLYWRKRETDESISEDISPVTVTTSAREEPPPRRQKRIPDATSSTPIMLSRHFPTPKQSSSRKEVLQDLDRSGTPFVVHKNPQMRTKWNNQIQKTQSIKAVKVVDGKNMFGGRETPQILESQIETQDLTPDDTDEVDLIPATLSLAKTKYVKSTEGVLGKRSRTSSTSKTPSTGNAPSKIRRARSGSQISRSREVEVKASPDSAAAKTSREMKEKVVDENKGRKRGLYR